MRPVRLLHFLTQFFSYGVEKRGLCEGLDAIVPKPELRGHTELRRHLWSWDIK
jgi:hypothetical protein